MGVLFIYFVMFTINHVGIVVCPASGVKTLFPLCGGGVTNSGRTL